jgi:hypothetical protein
MTYFKLCYPLPTLQLLRSQRLQLLLQCCCAFLNVHRSKDKDLDVFKH